MVKGYFFVLTPLQYLCALEAKHYYKNYFSAVELVVLNTQQHTLIQFYKLIDPKIWRGVIYVKGYDEGCNKKYLKSVINIIFKKSLLNIYIQKIKFNDFIFIGNRYDTYLWWLLGKVKSENKIILDDGLSTIINPDIIYSKKNRTKANNNFRGIIEQKYFPTNNVEIDNVIFFSLFNKIGFRNSKYVVNNLDFVKKYFRKSSYAKDDLVLFIGQPLVLHNIYSLNAYIEVVNNIKLFYENKGLRFQYCLHRSENPEQYPHHWQIVNFSQPIELQLLNQLALPETVVSFYSTALLTINILFTGLIKIVAVKPSFDITDSVIPIVYNYFKVCSNSSFVVIEDVKFFC